MAPGARSRGDERAAQPEKLQRLAEERFLAGDVAGALWVAREAQKRCRTPLPSSLAHALAAYEVHNAAAGGTNWYAVLGFGAGVGRTVSREDIKRRYRQLCLSLHPDKNSSAAADGAFKLLQEAWTTLSARHPPAPPSAERKPSNHSRPPPEAEKRRANPPAAPPPRTFRSVFCARCHQEFRAPEDEYEQYCGRCQQRQRQRNPRRHAPADPEPPRRRGGYRSFSCPGTCPVPGCRGQYVPCMVAVELWQLRCTSCRHEPGGPPMSREDLFDVYSEVNSTRSTSAGTFYYSSFL